MKTWTSRCVIIIVFLLQGCIEDTAPSRWLQVETGLYTHSFAEIVSLDDRTLLARGEVMPPSANRWPSRVVLRSTDGGDTWSAFDTTPITPTGFHFLERASDKVVYAATIPAHSFSSTQYMALFRSTDAGQTWTEVPGNYRDNPGSVYFWNESEGICMSGGRVLTTTDAGITWTVRTRNDLDVSDVQDLHFINRTLGFATDSFYDYSFYGSPTRSDGRLLKTSDGGLTWKDISRRVEPALSGIKEIVYIGDQEILLFTSARKLFQSTDAGETWKLVNSDIPIVPASSLFRDSLHGHIAGHTREGGEAGFGRTYGTNDGGKSWHAEVKTDGLEFPCSMTASGDKIFAVTTHGTILKRYWK